MTSIRIKAPAKVNLFLKVINKRKDSYHNLFTIFERISIYDNLYISKAPSGIAISSDKFITKAKKDNLAYKAARLILAKGGIREGVNIRIEKNIPMGAGLGGGSSDAAAVLTALNELFRLNYSKRRLIELGRSLGADVAFFAADTPFAIGRARGDRLEKLTSPLILWHLLIYPGFRISAEKIYKAFDASTGLSINPERSRRVDRGEDLTISGMDVKITSSHFNKRLTFDTAESMLYNDLEDTVKAEKSLIGRVKKRLASTLKKKAIVSGSGPSLFCLYRTRKEAMEARDVFLSMLSSREKESWQVLVAKTC